MRGVLKLVLIVGGLVMVGGLVLSLVGRLRDAAHIIRCQNNMRDIGQACDNYHGAFGHFPAGTVGNGAFNPEKRLSWLTQLWPGFMQGGTKSLLDETRAWDDSANCPPRCEHRIDMETAAMREELFGELRVFLCPANLGRAPASLPSPTHYVGIAGLGEHAAELPVSDPRAGLFGYDRRVSRGDIKDGLATTMAVAEVIDGGPWTAGGRATIRGLLPGDQPYLGERGQFSALHRDGYLFLGSRPVVTNILFADGSARPFTVSVSPGVFEALATIAGGEQVDELP